MIWIISIFLQIAYLTYMPSICFYLERFFLWPTKFQKLWAVVVDEAYRLDYILDIHIFFKIFPNLLACMWFCYAVIWKFALHLNETGFNSRHSLVSPDAICMVHVIWSSLTRFVCSGWMHGLDLYWRQGLIRGSQWRARLLFRWRNLMERFSLMEFFLNGMEIQWSMKHKLRSI